MKVYNIKNITCKLGENAKENWEMLNRVKSYFLFFHLSSFSSGYLIMECEEKPVLDILLQAAELCKNGTKYRNLKNIKVDYTPCSNLTLGNQLGEVIYKSKRKVKQLKLE